ncbi:MAG: tetratricopeptide repeat protein [Cyanobacteria bacterium SZAS LIN-2]|nr:tetratricopeptide repeat protein [Cyanobacteria bacterium SZAS LIN-2]
MAKSLIATSAALLMTISLPALAQNNRQLAATYCTRGGILLGKHNFRGALQLFELSVKADPTYAMAQQLLGATLAELDRKEEAIDHLREGLKLEPNCTNETIYLELGHALVLTGKPKEAIEVFSKGITHCKKSSELLCERGLLYAHLNQPEKGLQDATRAVEITPNTHFYHQRAIIYKQLHDYNKALKDYTTILQMEPNSTTAYSERAQVYKALGKMDLAAKDLEKGKNIYEMDLK